MTYREETDPELIIAAEQAYREAPPQLRGRFDRGRNRRFETVRRARDGEASGQRQVA